MKPIFLLTVALTILTSVVFPQCPEAGLKIQMPGCADPQNLAVTEVSCSSMRVSWPGNKNQTYIIKATFTEAQTNEIIEAGNISVSCEGTRCGAIIQAKDQTIIHWSVQAVCLEEDVTIFSSIIDGPDTYISLCEKVINIDKASTIHVYPNPSADYLYVLIENNLTGSIDFTIFDLAGKQVYSKRGNKATTKINNSYKLDLRNLPAGTYFLKVHSSKEISQVKFILLHK